MESVDNIEDRDRSVGTIRYKIHNFIHNMDRQYSDTVYIRHIPWRLKVFTKNYGIDRYLSAFLECQYSSTQTIWSCFARFEITIVSQSQNVENLTHKTEHKFNRKLYDWGFSRFAKFDTLMKASNGFRKAGTLIVEAKISADRPYGVVMTANTDHIFESLENKSIDLYPELVYFMNESESNVVFKVEGKRIPALKEVLSLKSDYFRSMFSGNYTESNAKEIEILDTTYNAFKSIVWFIYSHELPFNLTEETDFELIYSVYRLADRFQIKRLLDYYENQLKANITEENLELVSKIGFNYEINSLMTCVKAFIDKSYDQLIGEESHYVTKINGLTNNYLLLKLLPNPTKKSRRMN